MGTRSRIAMVNDDGSVKSIYCNWDGYYQYNGNILLNHYKDVNKIKELISLGDISSLGEEISPKDNTNHTFDNPQDGVTVAYHRDRGEDFNIKENKSLDEFLESGINTLMEEYVYVFKDNKWYANSTYNFYRSKEKVTLKELTQELIDSK